jgi:hypothetical protein
MSAGAADELGKRPEDGGFGEAQGVDGGGGEDPAPPDAADEVDFGDAPALVGEPDALGILVELASAIDAGAVETAGAGGDGALDLGVVVGADYPAGERQVGVELGDEMGKEQVLEGTDGGLDEAVDLGRRAVEAQLPPPGDVGAGAQGPPWRRETVPARRGRRVDAMGISDVGGG